MTNEPIGSGDDDTLLEEMFSSDRDRSATNAADGDDVQPPEQSTSGEEDAGQPDGQQDEPPSSEHPQRQVPLRELKAEREKRQAVEKALEDFKRENERRDAEYRRQLDDLTRRVTQPAQPQQQIQPPDPYTDPEGYTEYRTNAVQQQFEDRLLNFSEVSARRTFGSEKVDAAFQAAQSQGLIQQGAFLKTPDPWGEMVEWHKRYQAQQEVGTDIEAFKKRIAEETRQAVLAELKAGGAGKTAQRFPGTLADQTAAGAGGALPQSDEAMAAELFDPDRRSRQRFR